MHAHATDPLQAYGDLFKSAPLPPLMRQGIMEPHILKHYLLLHDDAAMPGAFARSASSMHLILQLAGHLYYCHVTPYFCRVHVSNAVCHCCMHCNGMSHHQVHVFGYQPRSYLAVVLTCHDLASAQFRPGLHLQIPFEICLGPQHRHSCSCWILQGLVLSHKLLLQFGDDSAGHCWLAESCKILVLLLGRSEEKLRQIQGSLGSTNCHLLKVNSGHHLALDLLQLVFPNTTAQACTRKLAMTPAGHASAQYVGTGCCAGPF